MVRVGRPDELFDQDEPTRPGPAPEPAAGRPRPALYDQDQNTRPTAPLRITSTPVVRPAPPGPPPGGRPPAAGRRGAAGQSTSRATAVLAAGTLASRLTGFARVLAIGYVLGVGSLSDAFNYANGVPNIVYDLLLGGILSATLIPVFVDQLKLPNRRESGRATSAVVTAIGAALVAVSVLLWLLAPYVIHFYLILNPASTAAAERALATRRTAGWRMSHTGFSRRPARRMAGSWTRSCSA